MSKQNELVQFSRGASGGGSKNLIINGAMTVAQRGTSSTAGGYQTVDRWGASLGDGTSTKAQSTDAPSGFANSFSITMSTAAGSIAGYNYVHQYLEGNLIDQLAFETADAKTITVSFYVKSSVTGTWGGAIRNYVASPATSYRSQSFTYTIDAANTWERKTVTISGDTGGSGQWNTGSLGAMSLFFDMGSVGLTQATGSWLGNNCIGATGTQTSFITTTNATWQITGVQLEVNDTATDFEHRLYSDELAKCQRYYERWDFPNSFDFYESGTANHTHDITSGFNGSLAVAKRALPTFSREGTYIVSNLISNTWTYRSGISVASWYNSASAAGRYYAYNSTAGAYIFDAEL